jgi:hypothetical protein
LSPPPEPFLYCSLYTLFQELTTTHLQSNHNRTYPQERHPSAPAPSCQQWNQDAETDFRGRPSTPSMAILPPIEVHCKSGGTSRRRKRRSSFQTPPLSSYQPVWERLGCLSLDRGERDLRRCFLEQYPYLFTGEASAYFCSSTTSKIGGGAGRKPPP